IPYQDLFSPALVSLVHADQAVDVSRGPVYLAISTKVLQSNPEVVSRFFEILKPESMVGYCFFVFDVTNSRPAYEWMAEVYAATG
ncbi:hypothetical protein, partial [Clostridium perfringens]